MKVLIISDYDCGCRWSVKELDGTDRTKEFNDVCVYDLFNILDYIMDDMTKDLDYYRYEYPSEFTLAWDLLESYDKVILCRDGNILIHDKNA